MGDDASSGRLVIPSAQDYPGHQSRGPTARVATALCWTASGPGQIAAWTLFVNTRVPGSAGTPEPVEPIALITKGAETLAILLALRGA